MIGNNPTINDVKKYYESFVSHLKLDLSGKNARLNEIKKFIDNKINGLELRSALDVGCGIGITTEHLRKYISNVTGVDISEANISIAKEKGISNYLCGDFNRLELGKYDLVCAFDVIEHIRKGDRESFLTTYIILAIS